MAQISRSRCKTKIIATIGPSSRSIPVLKKKSSGIPVIAAYRGKRKTAARAKINQAK